MKAVLKRNLGERPLTFEELTTLLTITEAALNSRPLEHLDALPPDGGIVLKPGHFLIERPLLCPALRTTNHRMVVPPHRRWKFLNLLAEELWLKWKTTYLQSLQIRSRWKTATDNIRKGDLVLLKDDSLLLHIGQQLWYLKSSLVKMVWSELWMFIVRERLIVDL